MKMRNIVSNVSARLQKQPPNLLVNEYKNKTRKLMTRSSDDESIKRQLVARMGEKAFWEKHDRMVEYAALWDAVDARDTSLVALSEIDRQLANNRIQIASVDKRLISLDEPLGESAGKASSSSLTSVDTETQVEPHPPVSADDSVDTDDFGKTKNDSAPDHGDSSASSAHNADLTAVKKELELTKKELEKTRESLLESKKHVNDGVRVVEEKGRRVMRGGAVCLGLSVVSAFAGVLIIVGAGSLGGAFLLTAGGVLLIIGIILLIVGASIKKRAAR